jgi:polyphosphate kinase
MSPIQIKPKLIKLIENEARYGKEGRIILKANSLAHPEIIRALYRASMAGCRVDLIIRGICCLRPGIEGVSDNISVSSIIGKYLEHPRIYYFEHDEPGCYISSADLMPRNLDRRIELMTPIFEKGLAERLYQILTLQLADTELRWELRKDGSYVRFERQEGANAINSQELLEKYVNKIYNKTRKSSANYVKRLAEKLLNES